MPAETQTETQVNWTVEETGPTVQTIRIRLSDMGRELKDEQVHLSITTYKDEITDQSGGWAIEGEHSPKPLGAWWLRFFWDRGEGRVRFEYARAA